jgi:hypothetical protein
MVKRTGKKLAQLQFREAEKAIASRAGVPVRTMRDFERIKSLFDRLNPDFSRRLTLEHYIEITTRKAEDIDEMDHYAVAAEKLLGQPLFHEVLPVMLHLDCDSAIIYFSTHPAILEFCHSRDVEPSDLLGLSLTLTVGKILDGEPLVEKGNNWRANYCSADIDRMREIILRVSEPE